MKTFEKVSKYEEVPSVAVSSTEANKVEKLLLITSDKNKIEVRVQYDRFLEGKNVYMMKDVDRDVNLSEHMKNASIISTILQCDELQTQVSEKDKRIEELLAENFEARRKLKEAEEKIERMKCPENCQQNHCDKEIRKPCPCEYWERKE